MEGGGENPIDVNEQKQHLRDFYRKEEIAGLIVLGSCPWSPEGFVNHVNSGVDEGLRAPFRQAAVRAPLIIWSGPDCRGAGGRYIRRVRGQAPFQLTGLLRLQHTCGLKIDSLLMCILSLADFICDFLVQGACCLFSVLFMFLLNSSGDRFELTGLTSMSHQFDNCRNEKMVFSNFTVKFLAGIPDYVVAKEGLYILTDFCV